MTSSGAEAVLRNQTVTNEPSCNEIVTSGVVNFPGSSRENAMQVEHDGEGSSSNDESNLFSFKPEIQKAGPEKVVTASATTGGIDLNRFSDTPGDASLKDLFSLLDRIPGHLGAEASTSDPEQRNLLRYYGGKKDLAKELKARMSQAHMDNAAGQKNGEVFLGMVIDAINEKVIDSSAFDENLHSDSIFHL